jgi:hypothetical protein
MSFQTGQRVVCINDDFPPIIHQLYHQLPTKGVTYTVREIFMGRANVATFKGEKS